MKKIGLVMLLCLSILFTGCSTEKKDTTTVKIAVQYGLAYAPLVICQELQLIEKENPAITVEWIQLNNTAAIREAMLSGDLDIGFLGIPPFLIGYENGMPWKLFTGLSESPLGLMTNQKQVESLTDLNGEAKIALPQPGSIQHILLMMAAKNQLGDSTFYDESLLSVKHPDGMQLLLNSNEIDAHFTSPPYLFEEKKLGMHEVLSGEEAFGGEFTFIVGAVYPSEKMNDAIIRDINQAIIKAQAYIKENPDQSAALLGKAFNLDESVIHEYLYDMGLVYDQTIKGLDYFVEFMKEEQFLKGAYTKDELVWNPEDEQ